METILLEEKNVPEYIYDSICSIRLGGNEIIDAKYHHNTSYKDAVSICKYGILTLADMNALGIRKDSKEFLKIMADTDSHVNGNNCVSLAIVGLDDIYPNEEEYNPLSPNLVDFLVSSNIKASRSSINYGNEFLSCGSIMRDSLRSIDTRLLKLLCQDKSYMSDSSNQTIIQKYNYLRAIALEIKKQKLELSLREMSESNIFELNQEKLVNLPKLLLKK